LVCYAIPNRKGGIPSHSNIFNTSDSLNKQGTKIYVGGIAPITGLLTIANDFKPEGVVIIAGHLSHP
jgi:hypothetical protein